MQALRPTTAQPGAMQIVETVFGTVPKRQNQIFKPEEIKALAAVTRRKRALNEALWAATEKGDTATMMRLLQPY